MRRLKVILICSALIGLAAAPTTSASGQALPVTSYDVTTKVRPTSERETARLLGTGVVLDRIGCWLFSKKVAGEFAGTIDLWWIKQRLAWCGYRSPGPTPTRWVAGPWWTEICRGRDWGITDAGGGWDWRGWEPGCKANSTGCKGCSHINRWARGRFDSFFQTARPWVEVWGYPNGDFRQEHGGNT